MEAQQTLRLRFPKDARKDVVLHGLFSDVLEWDYSRQIVRSPLK